jgi:uncharacterized protein (TIGR00369 family)
MSDEQKTFDIVREIFTERVAFNKILGVEIEAMSFENATVRFDNRPELIGNFVHKSLHGGVVSATLDLTGGLVAYLSVLKTMEGKTSREKRDRLANLGTIDLRIDYLRPGLGKHFIATGSILRAGNKVAVSRMDLRNEEGAHIATATGTYLVG